MEKNRIKAPKPGVYPGVPMSEYLAWDAWSASELKAALVSCEYARWYRGERVQTSTPAQELGTLVHTAVLEPKLWPPRDVEWIEGPYNANPGRRDKALAEAEGKRVLKPETKAQVEGIRDRARRHPFIAGLLQLSDLEREVSCVARCPQTGLLLKARADLRVPTLKIIADVKTTSTGGDRESFLRTVKSFRYYLSAAHYLEVFGLAEGAPYDEYLFLALDTFEPYSAYVWNLDPVTLAAGEDLAQLARRRVARCYQTGEWPGGNDRIQPLALGKWDLEKIQAFIETENA